MVLRRQLFGKSAGCSYRATSTTTTTTTAATAVSSLCHCGTTPTCAILLCTPQRSMSSSSSPPPPPSSSSSSSATKMSATMLSMALGAAKGVGAVDEKEARRIKMMAMMEEAKARREAKKVAAAAAGGGGGEVSHTGGSNHSSNKRASAAYTTSSSSMASSSFSSSSLPSASAEVAAAVIAFAQQKEQQQRMSSGSGGSSSLQSAATTTTKAAPSSSSSYLSSPPSSSSPSSPMEKPVVGTRFKFVDTAPSAKPSQQPQQQSSNKFAASSPPSASGARQGFQDETEIGMSSSSGGQHNNSNAKKARSFKYAGSNVAGIQQSSTVAATLSSSSSSSSPRSTATPNSSSNRDLNTSNKQGKADPQSSPSSLSSSLKEDNTAAVKGEDDVQTEADKRESGGTASAAAADDVKKNDHQSKKEAGVEGDEAEEDDDDPMSPVAEIDMFAKPRVLNYLKKWMTENEGRVGREGEGHGGRRGGDGGDGGVAFDTDDEDPFSSSSSSSQDQQRFCPSYGIGDVSKAFVSFKNASSPSNNNAAASSKTRQWRTDVRVPVLRPDNSIRIVHGVGYASDEKNSQAVAAMHVERCLDECGVQVFALPRMQQRHAEAARAAGRFAPLPNDRQRRDEDINVPYPLVYDPMFRKKSFSSASSSSHQKHKQQSNSSDADPTSTASKGPKLRHVGLNRDGLEPLVGLKTKSAILQEQQEAAAKEEEGGEEEGGGDSDSSFGGGGVGTKYARRSRRHKDITQETRERLEAQEKAMRAHGGAVYGKAFTGTQAYRDRIERERQLRDQKKFAIKYTCDPFGRGLFMSYGVEMFNNINTGNNNNAANSSPSQKVNRVDLMKEIREGKLFIDVQTEGGNEDEDGDNDFSNTTSSSFNSSNSHRNGNRPMTVAVGGIIAKGAAAVAATSSPSSSAAAATGPQHRTVIDADGSEVLEITLEDDKPQREGEGTTAANNNGNASANDFSIADDGTFNGSTGSSDAAAVTSAKLLNEQYVYGLRAASKHHDKIGVFTKMIDESEGDFFQIVDEQEYLSPPLTTFSYCYYNPHAVGNVDRYIKSYYRMEQALQLQEAEEELRLSGEDWDASFNHNSNGVVSGGGGFLHSDSLTDADGNIRVAESYKEKNNGSGMTTRRSEDEESAFDKSRREAEEALALDPEFSFLLNPNPELGGRGAEGEGEGGEKPAPPQRHTTKEEGDVTSTSTTPSQPNAPLSSSSQSPPTAATPLTARLDKFQRLAEQVGGMPPIKGLTDLITVTECESPYTVDVTMRTDVVTWYTATLVVPGIRVKEEEDGGENREGEGAKKMKDDHRDEEEKGPYNIGCFFPSSSASSPSSPLDADGASTPSFTIPPRTPRSVRNTNTNYFGRNPALERMTSEEIAAKYPMRPVTHSDRSLPGNVAMGRATTRERAIMLCAMHAESLIDSHGLCLHPEDDEKQRIHSREAIAFGRWAITPEEYRAEQLEMQHLKKIQMGETNSTTTTPSSPEDMILLPTAISDSAAINIRRPLKEWKRIFKKCGQKSRHRVSAQSEEEAIAQLHRVFITRHRMHLMEFGVMKSDPSDVYELQLCRKLILKFIEDAPEEYRREGRPACFYNFRYGAEVQIRSSILLPLPKEYGLRGGYAIGCNVEKAEGLASLHAVDTLCALCIPVSKDPAAQAELMAIRKAKGRIVPSGSPADVHPLMRSPPGYREADDTEGKPPIPSEVWRVMLMDVENFDYVRNIGRYESTIWVPSFATCHPEFNPEEYLTASKSGQYSVFRFPPRFCNAKEVPLTLILKQIVTNYLLANDIDDCGLHAVDTLFALGSKCSHYNGHQRRGNCTALAANNYWMELPVPRRFGRRVAWGRCITRKMAIQMTFTHIVRTLFALGLYPNERPAFMDPNYHRNQTTRPRPLPQTTMAAATTVSAAPAEGEGKGAADATATVMDENNNKNLLAGLTLFPANPNNPHSISHQVFRQTLFCGAKGLREREPVVQFDPLNVFQSLEQGKVPKPFRPTRLPRNVQHHHRANLHHQHHNHRKMVLKRGAGGGGGGVRVSSWNGGSRGEGKGENEDCDEVDDLVDESLVEARVFRSGTYSRMLWDIADWELWLSLPDGILADPRVAPRSKSPSAASNTNTANSASPAAATTSSSSSSPSNSDNSDGSDLHHRYTSKHGVRVTYAEDFVEVGSSSNDTNSNTSNTKEDGEAEEVSTVEIATECVGITTEVTSHAEEGAVAAGEEASRPTTQQKGEGEGGEEGAEVVVDNSPEALAANALKITKELYLKGFRGHQGVYNGKVFLADGTVVDEERFPSAWAIRVHRETLAQMTGGYVPDTIPSPNPVSGSSNWECVFGRLAFSSGGGYSRLPK